MQLDVGFGDAVVPVSVEIESTHAPDQPGPTFAPTRARRRLRRRSRRDDGLGTVNGRMKDFDHSWFLSEVRVLDGSLLRRAIEATFAARSTAIEATPIALSETFAREAEVRWNAFLRKSGLGDVPKEIRRRSSPGFEISSDRYSPRQPSRSTGSPAGHGRTGRETHSRVLSSLRDGRDFATSNTLKNDRAIDVEEDHDVVSIPRG